MEIKAKQILDDFTWVGVLDPDLRVFDIVMRTDYGTTYNSYVLKGTKKTVLFEASKSYCFDEWIARVESITPLSKIDALIVDHTEPDHSGTIERLIDLIPDLEIIGTTGAMNFLKEITNRSDFKARAVKDGDVLDIGGKTLQFIQAPNLHWPDTMFTYVPELKTLVTCDCFGSHYSDPNVTNEALTNYEDYMKATVYYYENIIGPFKGDALNALRKIDGLAIDVIATGHGPVITHNPSEVIELYRRWSSPKNPNAGKAVVIPYVSAYGYTKMMADAITEGIQSVADIDVQLYDMVYADFGEVMTAIANADGFLLGTPTIVGEALEPIWQIASSLNAKLHGGKFASAFGSYGWTGEGVPHIMERLRQLKLNVYGEGLRVRFKPNEEQLELAREFGVGFGASVRDGKIVDDRIE
ncbi:MAG: FprA family A-type flavoprotein [Clostridiales Family XIII bacterium]|jgi:flavorubredoxin|nr:FprA family A-type flavoprotein [Clostridiales Family XIII bacterium]